MNSTATLALVTLLTAGVAGTVRAEEAPREALAETTRELAQRAHQESAANAVKTQLSETKLDLDIELVGRTSVQVAAELRL